MEKMYGNQPEKIYEILLSRRNNNYEPGTCSDGNKLGLVIEGGGMRGVISCASVDALDQLGYSNCFDVICGTSAGAINGSYFTSKQINMGTSIYYESLTTKEFVNIFNYPNMMNIHYLYDEWITKGKALDVESVITSPIDLFISTTNIKTGELRYFKNHELDHEKLISVLRASSSTPLLCTNNEFIEGDHYSDGFVHAGIPIQKAISEQCTHIVGVLTRSIGYRKKQSKILKIFENFRLKKYSKQYLSSYHSRIETYNNSIELLYKNPYNICTLIIAPEVEEYIVSNGEIGETKLRRAAFESMRTTTNLFKGDFSKIKMYS